ncbi:putative kinetochore protein spc24 [Grosmannia clavigera kw1407]|uniref:Kinetochore protein Spc24 n=1 Tax=Grosmannia clavigera (strain kw1407 / UAMH 11150) TaxID=655863 RepID=F0XI30_GROCL|nr:putative kinetochore protein spc24 [Grosmannia clavigera kw1407]EFX03083.1 putative kinetochore protein spc24 [Grosmannia clavigera kw1407]
MLFEEDPSVLIQHTVDNFNIGPDKAAVARIKESLATLQEARQLQIEQTETSLKKLARQLNTLGSQHDELAAKHSAAAHASTISALDTEKFRVAKTASDLEMETERLSAQAADLSARLQELELQGDDGPASSDGGSGGNGSGSGGSMATEDEVLLRLKVYRSLGIELERDGREGEWTRAVVRNDRKGDVHVVNMDKKFSRFFYANYFWQTL